MHKNVKFESKNQYVRINGVAAEAAPLGVPHAMLMYIYMY